MEHNVLWLAMLLAANLGMSGCNRDLAEGVLQPTISVTVADPIVAVVSPNQVVQSDLGRLIGTWENKDEDGDGVLDEQDDYPFDASRSSYSTTTESSFNDNPSVATEISSNIPFKVEGVIEENGDGDVYKFQVTKEIVEANTPITFLLLMENLSFISTMSILDNNGIVIFEIKNNSEPLGYIEAISSIMFTSPGTYYIAIAEINLKGDPSARYILKAFNDTDFDGLSMATENALGINSEHPDTDGDNIHDGNEFYVKKLGKIDLDVDGDNIPNWLDSDSDGDGLSDEFEGIDDADNDGLGAFVDIDSDGNSIEDNIEAGNLFKPIDTDRDGIADFVDLDDDSDRLLDINDSDRLTKLSIDDNFQVFALSYSDPLGLNLTDRAFPGSKVFIQGHGIPRQNSYLIINNGNITYNIKISDFDGDGFFMYLPEDIDDEKEYEYFIANGDYKSNSKYFRVSSSLTPIVTELQSARYNIGDIITLKGRGFHQNMSVHLGTVIISPDSVINNEAIITIPENVTSGFIHVESLQLHSNDIFIDIN